MIDEETKLYRRRVDCLFNLVSDNQLKVEKLQKEVKELKNENKSIN